MHLAVARFGTVGHGWDPDPLSRTQPCAILTAHAPRLAPSVRQNPPESNPMAAPHVSRPAMSQRRRIGFFVFVSALAIAPPTAVPAQNQSALEQLVSADRAFAARAQSLDLIPALTAMFADSVVMPLPGGRFARTRDEAKAALAANPLNQNARALWRPVRAVVSSDGLHGFTAGYMTVKTDTATLPVKYLAYWTRGADGWRVAAYRRSPGSGTPPETMLPLLALPSAGSSAGAAGQHHLPSLVAAEKHFSDSSQKVGLGPAFAIFGRDDAINMGGPAVPGFVVSAAEIGKAVGGGSAPGTPSPVSWSADFALVAATGDLGVTFGLIRRNDPGAGPPPQAFFTIWARPGGKGEWRYIAE